MKEKKLVLAFSGGLDTSYCVKYLSLELGYEVYGAIVNTGGFSKNELKDIEKRAYQLGVKKFVVLEETENYYQKVIKYLIFGNVLKNNTYPLAVSSERITQSIALVNYTKSISAEYFAHGSTGAGNDQVRFDMAFHILAPEIKIITPIRDQKLSRKSEIDYLKSHGVEMNWEKAKYSVNKGIWGTSVGGAETLTSHLPLPDEAFPSPLTKNGSEKISLEFRKGELYKLNEEKLKPIEIIQKLSEIASQYAIGRDIHIGDTIIGIKGRVGFEAAAPLIIIKAHHTLEKHTLTKWQLYWKEQLANWYGMFIHEAQYFEPVMRNIEQFLESTQRFVDGKVFIELFSKRFEILGINSPNDLMSSKIAQYGEMQRNWTGDDVKGFTKIFANATQIFHNINNKND